MSLGKKRRAMVVIVAVFSALACGSGTAHLRAQGARVSNIPDPKPADYAGRKPVRVLVGQASYYADSLAGNRTASGDVYDPSRLTAASRDLPFGSIVRVIRRDTGRTVIVRINDRGPFANRRRILDLSRAAAKQLHMIERGVADIRAEVLVLSKKKARKRRR